MKIIDLTDSYIENILKKNDLLKYRKSFPSLFNHYFKYWAIKKYWRATLLTKKTVEKRKKMIMSRLPIVEKKLLKHSFDTKKLKVVLFVGQNTSNGHSMYDEGGFFVWLPVEAYSSIQQVDTFVMHEIIHALHYKKQKSFYFNTLPEKRNLARQLITEGLATWVTQKILKQKKEDSLWADYISIKEKKSWMKACAEKEDQIKEYISKNFNSKSNKIELFFANDENDVLKFRAGYYAGYEAINSIILDGGYDLETLFSLSFTEFKKLVKKYYLKK